MRPAPSQLRMVAAEGHGGLVAMMAVGDQQLLVGHQLLDVLPAPIFHMRWMAPYSSVTSAMGGESGGLIEQIVDRARRIGVQHEDRFEVSVGVLEQFHAVLLGTGEGLLVAEDDARRILFHLAERDEALADQSLAGIGDDEFLEIGEHAGFGVARPDAALRSTPAWCGWRGCRRFRFRCRPGWRSPRITRTRL